MEEKKRVAFKGELDCNPEPVDADENIKENLCATLDNANHMAQEILKMCRDISITLFYDGANAENKDNSPHCFRDALDIQAETLKEIAWEISLISKGIGVR